MMHRTYSLLGEEKSSFAAVVAELKQQKTASTWAQQTNDWAIEQVTNTTSAYPGSWYKGCLPKEMFLSVVLPEHFHNLPDGSYVFAANTPITEALGYYQKANQAFVAECLRHVAHLKEQIQKHGFTSSVVVACINGQVRHQDGLHRMLALMQLLQEGYQYTPIPAFAFFIEQAEPSA